MRAEAVEMAQPGDKVDFIGTFIVVPDVSQLAIPGWCILIVIIISLTNRTTFTSLFLHSLFPSFSFLIA